MAGGDRLVIGSALGGVLVGGVLGFVLAPDVRPAPEPAVAGPRSAAIGGDAEAWAAALRVKDAKIQELSLERLLLQSRIEELLEPREAALAAADESPQSARAPRADGRAPAAPGASRHADLAAWLKAVLPDRFEELSAEEIAQLTELDLRGAAVTDADLALLATMTDLSSLCLRGTAITDAGVFQLRSLTQLESLELRGTALTGAALRDLPTWDLQALHLTDTKVAGDDLFGMPPMAHLQTLKLNRLAFGDEHVEALARYPSVRHLELDSTSITDEGLARILAPNPGLTRIELRDTAVSVEQAQELAALSPGCELVLGSGPPIFVHR
jgi:hypothetical protein